MGPIARTLSLGAATVWLATDPVASQSPAPQEVTSDTPEYCLHLLDRVSQRIKASPGRRRRRRSPSCRARASPADVRPGSDARRYFAAAPGAHADDPSERRAVAIGEFPARYLRCAANLQQPHSRPWLSAMHRPTSGKPVARVSGDSQFGCSQTLREKCNGEVPTRVHPKAGASRQAPMAKAVLTTRLRSIRPTTIFRNSDTISRKLIGA